MNRRYDSMRVDVWTAASREYRALHGMIEIIPFEEDDPTIQPIREPMRRMKCQRWHRADRIKYRVAHGRPPIRKLFKVEVNDESEI